MWTWSVLILDYFSLYSAGTDAFVWYLKFLFNFVKLQQHTHVFDILLPHALEMTNMLAYKQ